MSFKNLGLSPALLSAIQEQGFDTPTPVQSAAIPPALAGHDLMVSSQTGSGKTAAFMLPALERLSREPASKNEGVQVLVLTPTRELAMQVADATTACARHLPSVRVVTVVGGMPYARQIKALKKRVDVLVATPGRLIDHVRSGRVDLSTVHTLIMDEADRMLDMGFIADMRAIVAQVGDDRQTLLFSATLDGSVARLAADMMREPQRIAISRAQKRHDNITQHLLYADDRAHKLRLLDHLLRDTDVDQAIVFTATKRGADALAGRLNKSGFAAVALHGDMNQRQRTRTVRMVQRRRARILVATDVAARGIDVQSITHAFNYDLPMQAEDYVHRIGRTGRAGRHGHAITLAAHADSQKIRRIERFLDQTIPVETVPGLEPTVVVKPAPAKKPGRRRIQRGKPMQPGTSARKGGKDRAKKPFVHGRSRPEGQPSRRRERSDRAAQ